MAANSPITSPAALLPDVATFLADVRARFVPNRYGQLDEQDFLHVFELAAQVFADWRHLNVKRVKGATYPVPYTDTLGLVPVDYRILGMQAEAVNGVNAATGAAGVTALPVFFALIKDSAGPINALLDAEATTTLTVKARWVRISGSDEDILASFEPLELEDHDYAAGDVRTYEFPGGETRLVQWRADSVGYTHPAPTGEDDDPVYAIFAPIIPAGVSPADFAALAARVKDLELNGTPGGGGADADALPAPEVNGLRTVAENFAIDSVVTLKQNRGFTGPNTGAADRNYLRGNWELRAYGADVDYKAFADANGYALVRKDYLAQFITAAIAAIPALVELSISFAAAGAQTRDLYINQQRLVGTVSLSSQTSGLANVAFKKNGTVVSLPVAVGLTDILTVSANSPAAGSLIVLSVA